MKKNKIFNRVGIILIVLIAFFLGYEMGVLPRMGNVSPAYAQNNIRYERCYALRTPSIGYDEFNKGEPDQEESIRIPPGWVPAGFTVSKRNSSGRALTLVCGPDNR